MFIFMDTSENKLEIFFAFFNCCIEELNKRCLEDVFILLEKNRIICYTEKAVEVRIKRTQQRQLS